VITSDIKLKTVINQGDYFGPIDTSMPNPVLLMKDKQDKFFNHPNILTLEISSLLHNRVG
jgi:hypothetical protein